MNKKISPKLRLKNLPPQKMILLSEKVLDGKKSHDYLHKSTFFFDSVILLKSMKSRLQKYKKSKKLESLPKKEKVCHKQLSLNFLNCL